MMRGLNKIILAITAFFSAINCTAQSIKFTDSLGILLSVQGPSQKSKKLSAILKYDFSAQYPYYIASANRVTLKGSRILLQVDDAPASGYLYVFTIDNANNVSFVDSKLCDTLGKLYNNDKEIFIKIENTKAISSVTILYSKEELDGFEKITSAIELINGSINTRIAKHFFEKLIYPSFNWNMVDKKIGFRFNEFIKNSTQKYLPITILMK